MEKIEDISQNIETVLISERPRLIRLYTRITGQADVAEDLVQETQMEVWHHLHTMYDLAKFPQWLSGIARSVCLRWLHQQGRANACMFELHSLADESLDMFKRHWQTSLTWKLSGNARSWQHYWTRP